MNVRIAGTPNAESDAKVARFLARFCEREHPGTVWQIGEGLEAGGPLEATGRKVADIGAGGVDDEGPIAA